MSGEPADQILARIKSEERNNASGSGAASGSATGSDHGNKDQDNGADQGKDDTNDIITLRLRENSRFQRELCWKFKRSETMWAHLQNYANSIQADFDTLRFVTHDGSRINHTETPESLELEEDEIIDVLPMATGGKCLSVLIRRHSGGYST